MGTTRDTTAGHPQPPRAHWRAGLLHPNRPSDGGIIPLVRPRSFASPARHDTNTKPIPISQWG
eukprot:3169245-Pyramimonas_sp.AAC.1